VNEDREQLRGVIAALLEPDGGLEEDHHAEQQPSLLDSAVRAASSTLERWSRGAPLRRLLGGIERDVLTSAGEWVPSRCQ
jgi:hypothetical protein